MLKRQVNVVSYLVFCLERTEWGKLVDNLVRKGALHSPKVIKAMRSVPRAKFLPQDKQSYSATDTPLPIGFGQTISAPHSSA
jgi:protein-L-isoaspartate(D-aspartate) O-methyltransferase